MTNKIIGVIAVLSILISGYSLYLSYASSPAAPSFGAVGVKLAENYDPYLRYNGGYYSNLPIQTNSTFQLSSSGTAINGIIATTCTGIVYASLAATTSQAIDCAVTGALSSAKSVTLGAPANLQSGNYGSLVIWGGHASSTAGYVEGYITNLTGQATTSYPLATTSIPVLVIQ